MIILDVQHIGKPKAKQDFGAYNLSLSEGFLTLDYATQVYRRLLNDNIPTILMTHGNYADRQAFANKMNADPRIDCNINLYVACHMNAGGGNYSLALVKKYDDTSVDIARTILDSIADRYHCRTYVRYMDESDRGYTCIKHCKMSSLILEPLFIDYKSHIEILENDLQGLALSIYEGIAKFYKSL